MVKSLKKSKFKLQLVLPWKNNQVLPTKYKLKKKWRFWRVFKRFFLQKKKNIFFFKIKWLFNQKRIIWHQLVSLYGKKIKNLIYTKNQTKVIFGSRFFKTLTLLEVRLNILVLRLRFALKLIEVDDLIQEGFIRVNGVIKNPRYLVRLRDVVKKSEKNISKISKKRLFSIKWRSWRVGFWKKILRKNNRRVPQTFKWAKKNLFINYLEVNYKILAGILLRNPLLGEILVANNKQMLSSKVLRKVYYLY